MIEKAFLEDKYIKSGKSMQDIANELGCSLHKVDYYMKKHNIKRRSRSDAIYLKNNPSGDPFSFKGANNLEDAELLGFGLGLYWGEGNKSNKHSVRLGNTNPDLLKKFMDFLVKLFNVRTGDFRFGLQIFSDIDPEEALNYWIKELGVKRSQFYKTTVTISGSIGSYRYKSKYGVLTVYYHNMKLRNLIVGMLPR